jgi:hypothetical protein
MAACISSGVAMALGFLPLFVWHRTIMAVTARRSLLPIALDRGKERVRTVCRLASQKSALWEASAGRRSTRKQLQPHETGVVDKKRPYRKVGNR